MSNKLTVGDRVVESRVWLAPMTGVSDLPFRRAAARLGAAYVATEMVACVELARGRPDVVRRAAVGEGLPLMVVQLVGRDPAMMAAGAKMAAAAGSALMRDLDLATSLVAAAVDAVDVPVTVKMRLGWDDASRNAPEFAARAQAVGARAVTVHGRTRSQFYKGVADWSAIADVKREISVPLIVNGDIVDLTSARAALQASGADGIMIGRGAYGRPWIAAQIDAGLEGRVLADPDMETRLAIALGHFRDALSFYGERLGLKMFRKHLASYIEAAPVPESPEARRAARAELCRLETPAEVEAALTRLWMSERRLAA